MLSYVVVLAKNIQFESCFCLKRLEGFAEIT